MDYVLIHTMYLTRSYSLSVAFTRIPVAFTRIRSHSVAFLFAFLSWTRALAPRREADRNRTSKRARRAGCSCIVKCWCNLLHGNVAQLLVVDELVHVAVLVSLHGRAGEVARPTGCLMCRHVGCFVLLRCVLHCCMVRMLLCAAAAAAELAVLLWRC